jgi:3-oxoacyl-[acyl-carrier-protein] synthase-3
MVETSDEWITTRTGIKQRRIAAADEYTSDMAARAAERAMARAGITPDQIDLIIVATVTPDMIFPSTACLVQHKLGAVRAAAFDLEAACAGFVYALEIGQQFIMSRTCDTVLVIGAEKLSSIVNWKDRNTCVLFGDGAGAVILQNRPGSHGLLTAVLGADGSKADLLRIPAGGCRLPASMETVAQKLHYIHMEGQETFKAAVEAMYTAAREALQRCNLDVSQLKCVIPHQANKRIIEAVCKKLGVKPNQIYVNLDRYGNTSAASVVIALDEAVQSGRIQRGDLVLLIVFGGGLTWAAAVIEW